LLLFDNLNKTHPFYNNLTIISTVCFGTEIITPTKTISQKGQVALLSFRPSGEILMAPSS